MHPISAKQSKAARALVEWSQEDLSQAAGLSISTIRNFENGFTPRHGSTLQIRKALENAGIEFTEEEGVKRRNDEVKIYRGFGSCDIFYNDLLQTAKQQGGDIYCVVKSQAMLMEACGITDCNDLEPFELLGDKASVKCLLSETNTSRFHVPSFQFRTLSPSHIDHPFYFGYGNKYAHVVQEGRSNFIFAVFRAPLTAQIYRSHFLSMWSTALPAQEQYDHQELRAKLAVRA